MWSSALGRPAMKASRSVMEGRLAALAASCSGAGAARDAIAFLPSRHRLDRSGGGPAMRRHAFLIMALAALCAPAAGQRGGGYIEPLYVEPEPEPAPPPATTPPAVVIPSYQVRPTPPPPPPPPPPPAARRARGDEL